MLPFGTIRNNGVFIAENTAIVSDIHYDVNSSQSVTDMLLSSIPQSVNEIILNGDVLHSFPPTDVFNDAVDKFVSDFESVVYIEGNHERMVGGVEGLLPDSVDYRTHIIREFESYTVCVAHGDLITHDMNFSECDYIVIGHLHPTTKSGRSCIFEAEFQFNTPKNASVIILPAYGDVGSSGSVNLQGTDFIADTAELTEIQVL